MGNNLTQIGLVDIKANYALVSWIYRIGLMGGYYYNKYTRLNNDVRTLMLKTTGRLETNAMSCEIIQME